MIVSIKNANVDIDGQRILHNIELDIEPGQHWGVVGSNGSGKSSLLALIAGKRWPAPGQGQRSYDFGAGPERDAVTARQKIALVGHELQDLYCARQWNFRARDIVLSGLTRTDIPRRHPSPEAQHAAARLLAAMDLGHLADRRLLELSRGEQRRVLITRSLAFEPALLLLDEPASGLDVAARRELEATLIKAAEHTTIVTAAHQTDDLPELTQQVAFLDAGRIQSIRPMRGHRAAPSSMPIAEPPPPTAASKPIVELNGVSAWIGGREVVKSIDWTIRSGEHWLITGPNGAGKSTLLRLLNAEIRPGRGGKIAWPGVADTRNVWHLRRQVALVSPELQSRYRYPTRVFDAVASGFHSSIGLTRALTAEQRRRVTELLRDFRLADLAQRLLSSLSYGQRHRALIARTLVTHPLLLLLDEPWEGLDAESTAIVCAQVTAHMARGTQLVCASHIGAKQLTLNRHLQLEDGRIVSADDSAVRRESSANAQPQAANYPPH